MYRLFVGVPLPREITAQLALLCNGLPSAKWVDADAMHITLRFIGEVDGGRAEDIHNFLSQVHAPAFELTLAGIDGFAQAGKIHTLWVGVEKAPPLIHLRDKVESAVVRAGLPPERRKFRAHVTLARFRNGIDDRLGMYLQRHNYFRSGPFAVDTFTLFRSHLTTKGAYYEEISVYPLEKGRRSQPPKHGGAPASAAESR